MDIEATERALKAKIKALYLSRHPEKGVMIDVEGFDDLMGRYRSVQRRITVHRQLMKGRRARREFHHGIGIEVALVRQAIVDSKTLMAFDVERTLSDLTKEIGVTLYRDGVFESHNYRAEGMKLKTGFSYGQTEVLPIKTLYGKVREHAHRAHYYVGHALIMDFEHLRRQGVVLTKHRYFDTLRWSQALLGFEEGNNLTALAEHFGMAEGFRAHNGGNDARMTMEVLIQMVKATED